MKKVLLFFVIISLVFSCDNKKDSKSDELPIVRANNLKASIRKGNDFRPNSWNISPHINPDDISVSVDKYNKKKVTFITDLDSISYNVKYGDVHEFLVITSTKDTARTRIITIPERVSFSEDYKAKYNNKTIVEIPKVYELINIVFALTDASKNEKRNGFAYKETNYYKKVMAAFDEFSDDTIVKQISEKLMKNSFNYFYLKMDSYAFKFNEDQIVNYGVYDRVSWGSTNTLSPYISGLEAFAEKVNFKQFYAENLSLYKEQINFYETKADISRMQHWLGINFPTTSYNSFKIVLSPLVGGNQSANNFNNNNFKESHAHINYPYHELANKEYSKEANIINGGNYVFTELNHTFMNPELGKYLEDKTLMKILGDIDFWATSKKSNAATNYGSPNAMFNEYMNWSLVSLYYYDYAPKKELNRLIAKMEKWQINPKVRGFKYFKEFNRNLLELYKSKRKNETIADLYPKIIEWSKMFYAKNK